MTMEQRVVFYKTTVSKCECLAWIYNGGTNGKLCRHQKFILGIKEEETGYDSDDSDDSMSIASEFSEPKKEYTTTSDSCTCGDWVYRRKQKGEKCKHMELYFIIQDLNKSMRVKV